ncbi:hypothetical protein IIA79_08570, partial [bacterium]|nr:hypothetical protein [bacterium]
MDSAMEIAAQIIMAIAVSGFLIFLWLRSRRGGGDQLSEENLFTFLEVFMENQQFKQRVTELQAKIRALPAAAGAKQRQALKAGLAISQSANDLFDQGAEAYERFDYREALRYWEASRDKQPTFAVWNNLGVVYCYHSRFEDALA